ncbi:MAG: hypothetical protein RR653_12280, partial [Clostridia bacterium]
AMREHAKVLLTREQERAATLQVAQARDKADKRTAWRIEGTLREFASFKPLNLWFDYPIHVADVGGTLMDASMGDVGAGSTWRTKGIAASGTAPKDKPDRLTQRREKLEMAYDALMVNGEVRVKDLVEYYGVSKSTVINYIDEHPKFTRENGLVKVASEGTKV